MCKLTGNNFTEKMAKAPLKISLITSAKYKESNRLARERSRQRKKKIKANKTLGMITINAPKSKDNIRATPKNAKQTETAMHAKAWRAINLTTI